MSPESATMAVVYAVIAIVAIMALGVGVLIYYSKRQTVEPQEKSKQTVQKTKFPVIFSLLSPKGICLFFLGCIAYFFYYAFLYDYFFWGKNIYETIESPNFGYNMLGLWFFTLALFASYYKLWKPTLEKTVTPPKPAMPKRVKAKKIPEPKSPPKPQPKRKESSLVLLAKKIRENGVV